MVRNTILQPFTLGSKFTHEHGSMDDVNMDDVSFIFQGQKSQIFSTLGGMNVNMEQKQFVIYLIAMETLLSWQKVVLYKSATLSL